MATNGVVHFISDVIDTLATDDCTQVLTNDGRFETLLTAVTKAGLVETLQVKLLLIDIETVPKKMRLAKKDAINKKSTILFQIA